MSRPAVTVVMPFAGTPVEAKAALAGLRAVGTAPGDALLLVDNQGVAPAADGVHIVRALAERSPAHARNAGAEHATTDWILFLDADTTAPQDLLDRYFAAPVGDRVGALAGAVVPAAGGQGLAARYGAAKGFLSQDAHLAHPYMPRAVAANLLVRRAAFEQIGGFFEGVRAAEDTDFSWRLQRAGWTLEGRPDAVVEHRYRESLRALRRQWRGYAAGRAWLRRRYRDFTPQPAVARAAGRVLRRRAGGGERPLPAAQRPDGASTSAAVSPRTRATYAALDAVLGVEELAGFALSNRPRSGSRPPAQVVLVADRFPAPGDPLADFALTLAAARVEAAARPERLDRAAARRLYVAYREDDGALARALSTARLAVRHPVRAARDRRDGGPPLTALAPAVGRLRRDPAARVHALGGADAQAVAARLAALSGRRLQG
jgi:hypothetical protein